MGAVFAGWIAGLLLGVRHALEPDHLAAVCTLVSDGGGARRGLWLGTLWGVGHSLSLLIVGALLAVLRTRLPPRVSNGFELAVIVMLIVLGVRALSRPFGDGDRGCARSSEPPRLARRSLVVGVVHGLAGSGALTALVLAELPSMPARIVYIALFGCGSMLGMALLSGLAGWPLARIGRSRRAAAFMALLSGAISIAFGVAWGLQLLRAANA
jgi:hypothetical protein